MNKIEEIRAEVERYIKHYKKLKRNDFRDGELYICYELLFFIDSLQHEQQEEPDKDLEKAARRYQEGVIVDTTIYYCGACEDVYFANRITDAFISGAKWQAERILEHVKLAYGKVSMNPFDCSEAFEELISKIESIWQK